MWRAVFCPLLGQGGCGTHAALWAQGSAERDGPFWLSIRRSEPGLCCAVTQWSYCARA